jgi:hypothetical protein
MIKVDLEQFWRDRDEQKSLRRSETNLLDEKNEEDMADIIFGQPYLFQIFESKINLSIEIGLYRSQTKAKSRVKVMKSITGH